MAAFTQRDIQEQMRRNLSIMDVDRDFIERKQAAIDGMLDYMSQNEDDVFYDEQFDPKYKRSDVDECERILNSFLLRLYRPRTSSDTTAVMKAVRKVVLLLNELNERCGYSLIETPQRDQLTSLICDAAARAGVDTTEDVTQEWRDW